MKKVLPFLLMLAACTKESSVQNQTTTLSNPSTALSNATLTAYGTLDLQTDNANIASLGVINYRSSYELCGTSGNDLLWPVVLPLADSATFAPSILTDGDSLSAEVDIDTTFKKNYTITLVVKENNVVVKNPTVLNQHFLDTKFAFHNGSRYDFTATVQ